MSYPRTFEFAEIWSTDQLAWHQGDTNTIWTSEQARIWEFLLEKFSREEIQAGITCVEEHKLPEYLRRNANIDKDKFGYHTVGFYTDNRRLFYTISPATIIRAAA